MKDISDSYEVNPDTAPQRQQLKDNLNAKKDRLDPCPSEFNAVDYHYFVFVDL
jgi:hypothetical protein